MNETKYEVLKKEIKKASELVRRIDTFKKYIEMLHKYDSAEDNYFIIKFKEKGIVYEVPVPRAWQQIIITQLSLDYRARKSTDEKDLCNICELGDDSDAER
jgi:hypothetical protein